MFILMLAFFKIIEQVKSVFWYLLVSYLIEVLLLAGLMFLFVLSISAGDRKLNTAPSKHILLKYIYR